MTISITHPFISLKGDGGDATLVRPSNWNANHTTSMATLKLLGRATAGVGAFEELSTTALVIAALNSATGVDFLNALGVGGFETGDVKFSINPTPATGWIAYNGEGTIGKSGSGATILASASAQPLYELIYNNIIDTWCPVSGGRSGVAATDFAAGKTIALPRFSGRTVIGAGTGNSLTARVNGAYAGAETQALSTTHLPAQTPAGSVATTITWPSGARFIKAPPAAAGYVGYGGSASGADDVVASTTTVSSTFTGTAFAGQNATPFNIMQPYVPLWAKVKL